MTGQCTVCGAKGVEVVNQPELLKFIDVEADGNGTFEVCDDCLKITNKMVEVFNEFEERVKLNPDYDENEFNNEQQQQ